jgi:hypothetical protein
LANISDNSSPCLYEKISSPSAGEEIQGKVTTLDEKPFPTMYNERTLSFMKGVKEGCNPS